MFIHSSPIESTTTEIKRNRVKDAQKKDVQFEAAEVACRQQKLHDTLQKMATHSTTVMHNPEMSAAENHTQTHAELTASYATHYANYKPENHADGPVKDFIESAKNLHADTLDTVAMLAADPSDTQALATLNNVLPNSLETLNTKALSAMSLSPTASGSGNDDPDAAATAARFANLLSELVNEGGYDPAHSIDVDLMHAVFSSIDIGTGVAKASGQVTDLYTKVSAMINDLLAIANYFNVVYNEVKAEYQKHSNSDHPAPPTVSWDAMNVQSGDVTYGSIADALSGNPSVNSDFYNGDQHYKTATSAAGDVGISSDSLSPPPIPGNEQLRKLFQNPPNNGVLSPRVVSAMVGVVGRAMKGLVTDETGQTGGQFYESWQDMASSDGKVSGALQGLSSSVSSLSQKAGQNTNTVSILLNSIMSLFQKLMDLISASGSARDRISSS